MNYNGFTMDELANVLINEPELERFIEASKQFVQKYKDTTLYTEEQMEEAKEAANQEGFDDGQQQGHAEALEESALDIEELLQQLAELQEVD